MAQQRRKTGCNAMLRIFFVGLLRGMVLLPAVAKWIAVLRRVVLGAG